jgi:hypothetical protein
MYENRMEAFAGMLARPPFTRGPFGRRARPGVGALIVLALLGSGSAVSGAAQQGPFTEAREEMVRRYIVSVHPLMEPIGDPAVIEALRAVPRHEFVPPELRDAAYLNQPLPIGHGQTISQPYIVALMTQLLELEPGDKTLEIGTGWLRAPRFGFSVSATMPSIGGTATGTSAGPSTGRSTASWSRPPPPTSRRHSWSSSPWGGGW